MFSYCVFLFNISKLYFQGVRARATERNKERKKEKKKPPRKKIAAVRGEGRGSFLLRRAESLF